MELPPESSQNSSEETGFTRKELFHLLVHHLNDNASKAHEIIEMILSEKLGASYTLSANEKQTIRKLLYDMKKKWQEARRTEAWFLEKNTDCTQKNVLLQTTKI